MQLYIEGLCHGNLLEEEAVYISDVFRSNLSIQPLPLELRHKELVMCLSPCADLARDVKVKNKLERNSVVEVIGKGTVGAQRTFVCLVTTKFTLFPSSICSFIFRLNQKKRRP